MSESSIFYLAGDHNVVKLFPLFGKGTIVKVWAQHGLVKTENETTGAYQAMTWVDAADRTLALSEMIVRSHEEGYYSDETNRLQNFVVSMETVIRQAKEQGGPESDPAPRNFNTKLVPIECECW